MSDERKTPVGVAASAIKALLGTSADESVEAARAVLDALAGLIPGTGTLTAEEARGINTSTKQMPLTEPFCCFVPTKGLWVGEIGWAIAPDYMAAQARAEEERRQKLAQNRD